MPTSILLRHQVELIDGSQAIGVPANPLSVSVATSALPSNAATETTLSSALASLASIATAIGDVLEALRDEKPTYTAEGQYTAATDANAISILNPEDSSTIMKVWGLYAIGVASFVTYQVRRITEHTGGTIVGAPHWLQDDPALAEVIVEPASVTEVGTGALLRTVLITNTVPMVESGRPIGNRSSRPWTLMPGEGLYVKQVSDLSAAVTVGLTWTEEPIVLSF